MSLEKTALPVSANRRTGKKHFSLKEANDALVYVERVVEDLMGCYCEVVDLRRRIEHPDVGDHSEHLEAVYEDAMDRLGEFVDELHHVGVELKDFEKGIVDFPAVDGGRDVCLCWKFGEDQILSWHETDAGYTGRQHVDLLAH